MKAFKKNPNTKNARRIFLKNASIGAAAFTIVPRSVLGKGFVAPSDTLYIAGIGVGGKGTSDLTGFAKNSKSKIAFLCDVDDVRATKSKENFPEAAYFKDYREMLDKEHKNIDAVSVSTPDHNHAIQTLAAMELGKHVYVQKPLTHDIYEARMLTEAAVKYKVVTQMGNQGASGDGVRQLIDWYNAGIVGDIHTVYCWTNRPVWPQGIVWPVKSAKPPKTLDWDLWLGTAPKKDYIDKLVPFNWRGWWDYGTGALGDMGCHIIEPPFKVLGLGYPTDVQSSVGNVYVDEFKRGYFPDSCPPSSHVTMNFPERNGKSAVTMHWMDGGIQPERPEELGPNEIMGGGANGVVMVGTKGKIMCDTYGRKPSLLPTSLNDLVSVPESVVRVPNADDGGHYTQWVDACIAGYGNIELSSDFKIAGPLTESILMGNLAIRSYEIQKPRTEDPTKFDYPGRYIKLLWDGPNMKVTNFDDANAFVKRDYRTGW